jgi:hypothetical protein
MDRVVTGNMVRTLKKTVLVVNKLGSVEIRLAINSRINQQPRNDIAMNIISSMAHKKE